MEIIKGDLIELAVSGKAGIIVHGCNCFHAMGSGIAGALAARFPEIPRIDRQTTAKGDPSKLGLYSLAHVTQETYGTGTSGGFPKLALRPLKEPFQCVNLYTQYNPGPDFIPSIFPFALKELNQDFAGKTLWFPRIGCGIGGGDWLKVEDQLLTLLPDVDVKVVVL
jgi:O-acetyl-ADP-ribose deacetylase (regulator of RNase III)